MSPHKQRQRNTHISNISFSIDFPSSWKLQEHPECAQVLSPSGLAAVTISTFAVVSGEGEADTDASHHLKSFIEGHQDVRLLQQTHNRAEADYTEKDGRLWRVVVATTSRSMVVGTLNGKEGTEFVEGQRILESLQPS